ncbi:ComF family protein [Phycicoccus sonneratiae]|uniref:ComF family protein n=1 Tax=Phycicoccus sonneratiae TaxID=2807628 RepID=A0ABS2CM24_9MICO|nr:phosphoribosyltransferase family protein [Phycicoccus sonneraticus]MBM6400919.1 ComF family protein [Phycicoccus sonneraticus]
MGGTRRRWGGGLRAAAGLVLPVRCAGCGAPGEGWCPRCRHEARRPAGGLTVGAGVPPCWSATPLVGPVRRAVSAHKDGGRRDLHPVLVDLLAAALARALAEDPVLRAAVAAGGPVLVVPVPETRSAARRRGEDPVGRLAGAAVGRLDDPGVALVPVLRHTRRVADQSRLGRSERAANLAGALGVAGRGAERVVGAACVVVDDVVTTGATLGEAARALRAAGAAHVVAATVAATPGAPPGRPRLHEEGDPADGPGSAVGVVRVRSDG